MTRLPSPSDPAPETAQLLALTARPGRAEPATINALANQPTLLGPFLGWAAALALTGVLSTRDHELLAMRAAYNCRSAFEWGEHAVDAAAAGLSDAEIDRIATGPDADGWSPTEAALLRAADELHENCRISERTWADLAATYDAPALVEILYVVGQYTMLSMVAEGAAIAPEPGFRPLP
jgi:alkylhydroperoxidase family enzyme